ncbi:hypothetical protein P8452_40632 [Trifolium repens]|nr:hypothetical protein P8452_40632 [Trifolium repens]
MFLRGKGHDAVVCVTAWEAYDGTVIAGSHEFIDVAVLEGSHAKPSTCKNACNAFPGVHSHALKRKQFAEDSLTGKNYAFKDYLLTIFMRRS